MTMKGRKKDKTGYGNQKPLTQPLPAYIYAWISLGSLIIGIGLLFLYIFKAGDLVNQGIDKTVFYVLSIPLGIAAAAFLFGAMRTYARYTGKVFSGRLEVMGPAVVFFLVIILGFVLIPESKPFSFTIYLQDSAGATVLKDRGQVILRLEDNPVTGTIDAHGSADFKGIPPQFISREVTVNLEAKGWQFANGSLSTTCRLKGNNTVLVIEKDESQAHLTGTVTDEAGHLIPGAKVSVQNLSVLTDANGWFSLEIPPEKQAEKQLFSVHKEGYRPYRDFAYPANPTKLVIVLKMEEE